MNDRDNEIRNSQGSENAPANNLNESTGSLYSYNYRNKEQHSATHDGDYDARRDSMESQTNAQSSSYGFQSKYQTDGSSYQNNTSSEAAGWNQAQGTGRSYYNPQDGSVYTAERKSRKEGFGKNGGFGNGLLKCVVFAVIFGLVAGGVFQGVARMGNPGASNRNEAASTNNSGNNIDIDGGGTIGTTPVSTAITVTDVSDIVDNVMPAIVSITSMSQIEYYNFFGQSQSYEGENAGSGIIVAEDDAYLYIVTNNHVVQNATSLTISFVDDATVAATVKGTDSGSDLAVVSVPKEEMSADTLAAIKIATLGNSDELKVGESAVAIGNALGYGQSVTTGVISALNREVTTTDSSTGSSVTNELVQTDAAINPGNSGGALLNMNGEVIGINSVKYSDTAVEGMGYAIPINTAQPIINELITREKVSEAKSAYLGISGVDVTSELARTYNMPEGVYIAQVARGSAAEKAGLVVGDIITAFDGKNIKSMDSLKETLQYYEAGTTVDITIKYADRGTYVEETVSVTLGSKNN